MGFFTRNSKRSGKSLQERRLCPGGPLMLRSEGNQINFLMTATVEQMVPQDHPLMKVARNIDFGFVREETEKLYAQGRGRPAYPPEQQIGRASCRERV